jgi:hypothetical protein
LFSRVFPSHERRLCQMLRTAVVGGAATALAVWAWCRWQRLAQKDARTLIRNGAAGQAPCAPEDEDQALAAPPKSPSVALPPLDPLPDEEFPTRVKGAAEAGRSTSSKVSGSPQSKSRQAWQQRQQRGELCDELPSKAPDSAPSTLPAPALAPTPAPVRTTAASVADAGKVAALVALAGKKKQSGNDALKEGVCVLIAPSHLPCACCVSLCSQASPLTSKPL